MYDGEKKGQAVLVRKEILMVGSGRDKWLSLD